MTTTNVTGAMPAFQHHGFPTFVRISLREARRGGAMGYEEAGYRFGSALEREVPIDAELEQWYDELQAVDDLLEDDAMLLGWLQRTYPRVLREVPGRRLQQFAAGVRRGRFGQQ